MKNGASLVLVNVDSIVKGEVVCTVYDSALVVRDEVEVTRSLNTSPLSGPVDSDQSLLRLPDDLTSCNRGDVLAMALGSLFQQDVDSALVLQSGVIH